MTPVVSILPCLSAMCVSVNPHVFAADKLGDPVHLTLFSSGRGFLCFSNKALDVHSFVCPDGLSYSLVVCFLVLLIVSLFLFLSRSL